ncbi:MAG: tyrosine--tRNA ligase [Epsilonproteobacteria bacterium]|nr:MAG: tyrosine--tRNA ligase [Campylobacterota bacterium]
MANEELLGNIIDSNSSFYIGFDPTADSLHLGHYSSFNVARIVTEQTGMKPIFVIGGFTGAIGDPSGKSDERKIMSKEVLEENIASIMNQIKSLASMVGITDFEIVNNNDFYNNMTIIELFQNYGKLFNVNKMLSKDMVKSRLDSGISLTEFSYQMFQSIDFLKLFENFNTKLQIGGSDQ